MDTPIPWKIADLIIRQWSKELTPEEETALREWITSQESNQVFYQKVIAGKGFDHFCQQASEHNYRQKYQAFRSHIRKRKLRKWRRIGYAAAAILLPFVLSISLYLKSEQKNTSIQSTEIIPGTYQAVLTLSNGQDIFLSPITEKNKLEATTATLEGNTLVYPETDTTTAPVYHKITIPRGGEYILRLADGTRVWLNSETELEYPVVFTKKQRQVFLKGEAYFEVAPDSLHPFIVKTEQQNLRVLGTSFAIRAYANESVVLTTLETGKVNIHSKGQEVILTPGEQSCLKGGNLTVAKVNTTLFTAWHKGIFIFQDQPLENILNTLARWYNIDIFYTNENLKDIHFTGELKRYDRIQDFLCKLEILEKVRFTIKGRTVTVSIY